MASPLEFEGLLDKLLDERLTADEQERLEQLLQTQSSENRKKYFEYCDIQLSMVEQGELERAALGTDVRVAVDKRSAQTAKHSKWYLGSLAISAVLGAFFTVALLKPLLDGNAALDLAGGKRRVSRETPLPREASQPRYVAEIGASSSAVNWSKNAGPRDFLMRLAIGESVELQEGVVTLEYSSGASLLLQGPCEFRLTGENSGYLARGRITGRVSAGDFVLKTPTAEVVDLGTEFGALVDEMLSTEVFVFDGKVSLSAAGSQKPLEVSPAILLSDGMAARTTSRGKLDTATQVDHRQFMRSLESASLPPEVASLSLVDLMNGFGEGASRLAIGIDPNTGGAFHGSLTAPAEPSMTSRGIYHVTSWHPTIDGVFIPSRDGMQVQVDSLGGTVDLPACGASTSGPIWSRRRISDTSGVRFHRDFWGRGTLQRVMQRLQTCDGGMIGLHANAGVTFDLQAIRDRFGRSPARFRSVLANLDNSPREEESRKDGTSERRFVADFRLYVDGRLRRSRLAFGRSDGDMVVTTDLNDADRFLTIATTDAGHYWYDQVVLIDPTLELKPAPPRETSLHASVTMPLAVNPTDVSSR